MAARIDGTHCQSMRRSLSGKISHVNLLSILSNCRLGILPNRAGGYPPIEGCSRCVQRRGLIRSQSAMPRLADLSREFDRHGTPIAMTHPEQQTFDRFSE